MVKYKMRAGHLLDVKDVNGEICVYMEIDERYREKEIYLIAVGTGWEMDRTLDGWKYAGTVVQDYVWHVYITADWDKGKGLMS